MTNKSQKLLALIFASVTLTSTVVIAYSLDSYVGISLAVRSLSAFVEDFDIELVDEGHLIVKTNVTVNNPSSYEFSWIGLEQQVYVNDTYAGSVRSGDLSQMKPAPISPRSETNHTLELRISFEHKPELFEWLLDPDITKNWITFVNVFCEGPLIGSFRLSTSALKQTS
jgi:LEA14-like dessication related protein